ncbi:UNVERIFIED_CONTAM: hypothetical protein K2H54_046546 [Gekko kuhli]
MAISSPVAGGGLQGFLLQLHGTLQSPDPASAALHGHSLIRSMAETCVTSSGDVARALQTSLVFSKEDGLLAFIHKSLSTEEFRECREEILKFFCAFLEKIGEKIHPYAHDVKRTCIIVYTKDKSAKCRIPALELLIKLLQNVRSACVMEDMKVGEIFNKFYGELAVRSKVPDTVLERIYELLGVLGEVQPSDMLENSEKLFRACLGELKTQMTSSTREPKFPVVAGCLKGLTALMYNFTKSMDEDPQTSKEIFDFAVKAINPQVDLKRYAVPLAGLHMFSVHAVQFSTCLLDNYVSLFEVMSKWCGHQNAELRKFGNSALDAFLKQVSVMVAKDAEIHKSKLNYFMKQFYSIIRKMDSSNKELSIAIRGYGLFAAPCKAINSKDVDFMYVELLQRCKQMYLTEAETMDDHVYQLPSFLQSIASVIFHLDTIPEVYSPVLERLIVVQIDSFPQYSIKMQSTCYKSIVKVFLALASKGPVLWSIMSTVGVSASEERPASGEVRSGKWKVPTYKDYLDLFRSLLSCDTMKDSLLADETCLMANSSLQSLNRLLYDELIKSILKIIEKLELTVQKQNVNDEKDANEADADLTIPTSDPAANLHPTKPKDFTAFINLVEFCREILPEKHIEYFEPWVYSFGYELIIQSTRSPFISGFYKLLSIAMKIAKKIKYFEGVAPKSKKKCPENPEKSSCFALFAKFGKEVTAKMKQYKDELLASCLIFVLSLPHDIIMLDIKAYIPALQNAFKLGLSYTPMAEVALGALEDWSAHIPRYTMQPYYKDILPCLDGYLKTPTSTDYSQNNWEVKKLSQAVQKGSNKVVIQRLKKAKNLALEEDHSLEAVRMRVACLLGSLGGQINRNLVTAASAEERMKKFVSWDTEKHLSFAVPFADMKPVIYMDIFLPRVTELALSASDRQTKVTRQLYEPLVMQLIHWFTTNKKFESQDTVTLLKAILDGIVDPVDSPLRDFCGRCVREFLRWSIKQTTPQQQERSPVNTKSLFKRLYSFALHPNAFKRLGAALAFNSIYREFREENALVDQFVFEALVVYLESLALTHGDEKSLGTTQQCCDAVDHLKRIIKHKASTLNKESQRRLPRGFPPAKSICLEDIVMWLFLQCGRPQTECRHKAMELFFEFIPLLPGSKSPSVWLDDTLRKQEISFLIKKFEGGGDEGKSVSGILSHPTLSGLQENFSLRAVVQWMDMLLAALDCYNTFIEQGMIKPNEILATNTESSFMTSVEFFLEKLALYDVSGAEQCFNTVSKGNIFSPQEKEDYNYSKCTIIVRIMVFVSMILETCQQDFWKLLERELLNKNLIELTVRTVCDPKSIGFNTADVQVMEKLPDICVRLIKALMRSPYKESLETSMKKVITLESIEEFYGVELYNPDSRLDHVRLGAILSACKQLHRVGLLHCTLQSQVGTILNGMLDQSFRDRAAHKQQGVKLVNAILKNWIDSSVSFSTQHEAFSDVFNTYTSLLTDQNLGLNLKFLDALELSQSPMLLQLMTEILCRDHRHIMEEQFEISFIRIARRGSCYKQVVLLDTVHKMFQSETLLSSATRQAYVDRSLLTLLLHCSTDALDDFFCKIIVEAMDSLRSRFTKSNETMFDTQLTKKMSYYKILEVMYSRLSKEDVYSKDSRINQAFLRSTSVEGNELTKTLIKSCYEAFTENMSGETQLLEKRRQYHCAAYNCAIAVISCVFNESKFYQGFLFTEKLDKNLLIFENLLDLQHRYSFPIEVEVPLERKKRYIAIRKDAREAMSVDSAEPHYLASASYMADSSLSEEMSQFDFSTGVQSFSYNSQDPTASASQVRRKEPTESIGLSDIMELEMDELNQHECMASMTTLIKHMHRNNITPTVEKGAVLPDLPPWMKFLHTKLGNPSVPLNIRLFVAKLIVNTEEVFQPYAKQFLGPLLQLIVSGDNGGEGIHYMVVEIVVTLLSWTSIATPKGNVKDEILANRLLEFLMKNAFHQKRAVFRHNLEIIKTVVECWKDCLSIPYRIIFERFSGGDPNTKDNSVGIQLLGIVLANNLPPYDPKCEIDNVRYLSVCCSIKFTRKHSTTAVIVRDRETMQMLTPG